MFFFFFFNDTATTEIYTLSLHDALPIYCDQRIAPLKGVVPLFRSNSGKRDRKSTRLNSSHVRISYAVFCLKKKKNNISQNHVYDQISNLTDDVLAVPIYNLAA